MNAARRLRPLGGRAARKLASFAIAAVVGVVRLLSPSSGFRTPPERILIIRLDLLGDVARTMFLARALRLSFPYARLTLLALPYAAPVAALSSDVDEVISVDTNRIRTLRGLLNPSTWREYLRVWRLLRAAHFDLAISASGAMASLWAWLSGASRTIGYSGEAYPFVLTDAIAGRRFSERRHELEYLQGLADAAEAGRLATSDSPLILHAAAGERMVARIGARPGQPLVVVHPGSVNGAAKRWPAENWAGFCDRLQETAAKVILIGSPTEAPLANDVVALGRTSIESLAGKTDVGDLMAVLSLARLVVGGDSGPVHLAAALGRPTLAVYGPTDPVTYGPRGPAATRVLTANLPCSPCYAATAPAECPLGDPICMRLVTVDEMVEAARQMLAEGERI